MKKTLSPKERMAIERVRMPEQDPQQRNTNFAEVNLGLTEEQAIREAQRCLLCKNRPCVAGCPVRVRIPEFIAALAEGNLPEAARILLADNTLPAVCGRVCPQETQCEAVCVRGAKGAPVAVGYLERYVADWAMAHPDQLPHEPLPAPTGKKVAIVGSGPAGLTMAGELARMGHAVTVFEALHETGGVLRYGIPEFRLPKRIVDLEVARLKAIGVEIECNVVVGKTLTLDELRRDFDAVFIGNGAGLPVMLDIPGENLKGVYSANEYLTRVNLMAAWRSDRPTPIIHGKRVVVIGGGNTAMDAVRTSRRLGAERSIILYRRTEAEMPARIEGNPPRQGRGHRIHPAGGAPGDPRQRAGLGQGLALSAHGTGRTGCFRTPPPGPHSRRHLRTGSRRGGQCHRHACQSAADRHRTGPEAQQVGQHRNGRKRCHQPARRLRRRRYRPRRRHGHPGHGRRQNGGPLHR